ncbi:MAG: polysaccharide deacetylase family protein, partial [Gemmatimonadota bacterium]
MPRRPRFGARADLSSASGAPLRSSRVQMQNLQALPSHLLRWVEASFLCEVPMRTRLVGLTFDDGPDPESTPAVLEALSRGGHTATFFCIGRNARRHPALVRAAAAAG